MPHHHSSASRRASPAAGFRLPRNPALLPLLLLSQIANPVASHPYPKDDLHDAGLGFLMPRDCANYCGYNNMYCCASEQECFTSSNIAGCRNTAAGGGYNLYTTTWTQTETFTSTYSSYFPAATTVASANCVPEEGTGQIACGSICCANWQYCAYDGQCMANVAVATTATATAVAATTTVWSTYTSSGVVVTTGYSAPYRVTSGVTVVAGTTVAASTTEFTSTSTSETGTALSATSTASGNGTISTNSGSSLSGGAIAGIVIGTLAGVALLIALCACCIIRGLFNTVLSIFGLGGKRREREDVTIIEEERIRRNSGQHSGWFGGGRTSTVNEKRKSSTGAVGAGAAIGTLLLLLGLRKHEKDKEQRQYRSNQRSDISSTYYSGSYTPSGYSSRDSRRTRDTRGSRRSDITRISRDSRPSRIRR